MLVFRLSYIREVWASENLRLSTCTKFQIQCIGYESYHMKHLVCSIPYAAYHICCVITVYLSKWKDSGDDLMISLNIIICRNHVHATFKENLKYCHLKFSKIDPITRVVWRIQLEFDVTQWWTYQDFIYILSLQWAIFAIFNMRDAHTSTFLNFQYGWYPFWARAGFKLEDWTNVCELRDHK